MLAATTAWSQNLLYNGDFEADPLFDGWVLSENVLQFGGLAQGSTRSAILEGQGQRIGQDLPYGGTDWYLDFFFATRDAGANRAFSLLVNQAASADNTGAATINLRYQTAQFNTFAEGNWGTDLGLGTIQPSNDANSDGDLNDSGDSKFVYRMRITGHSWGMAAANYDVELSEANSTNLTRRVNGLTRFQSGSGVNGPPQSFVFNTAFGSNPGFWIDDVEFGIIELPDDPNLEVTLAGELFGRLPVDSTTAERSLTIQNSGFTQDLVITNGVITGADASRYSLVTALPVAIAAGASTNLVVRFNPGDGSRSYAATLELLSNDPSTPSFNVNLSAVRLLTGAQVFQNPDFNATPFGSGWITSGAVLPVEGLVPGSSSAAWLSTNGVLLGQNTINSGDWHLDFHFAVTNVGESLADTFGLYVTSVGDIFNTGEIKLRLQYVGNTWVVLGVERPELGTLLPSIDANQDGDLSDPNDVRNVYRMRIVGRAWNTDTATVDIQLSDANSTALTHLLPELPLNTGSAVPYGFAFTTGMNENPGFWVDDARLFVGTPGLRITNLQLPSASQFQLTWESVPGANYFIDTATTLGGQWNLGTYGPVVSEGSTTGYTNTTSGDRMFFRVRQQQ